jgi:hypothetical protein
MAYAIGAILSLLGIVLYAVVETGGSCVRINNNSKRLKEGRFLIEKERDRLYAHE